MCLQAVPAMVESTTELERVGRESGSPFCCVNPMYKTVPMVTYSVLSTRTSLTDYINKMMTWFRSYLTDRTQTFVVGEDKHGPLPVNCSVPQGSVLGPISLSHTRRMCQNSSSVTESVIICLLTTSNCTLPFLQTRFMSAVNA